MSEHQYNDLLICRRCGILEEYGHNNLCYERKPAPSNSKSEDTKYNNKPSNYTLELESKISPEPSQDSPLGQVTSLDKLADDIEAMICDWNAPRQLTGSVREAAEKMAKWHKAEVANLLQVIEDEVIEISSNPRIYNGHEVRARDDLKDEQRQTLKKLKDNVINGGSL